MWTVCDIVYWGEWGCSMWAYGNKGERGREEERERERGSEWCASGQCDAVRYLRAKWGFSFPLQAPGLLHPSPARIHNFPDNGRVGSPLEPRAGSAAAAAAVSPSPSPQRRKERGEDLLSVSCAQRHACVIPCGDSRGEWGSCHQIPADAPTVIHWGLSRREKTFIRSSQSGGGGNRLFFKYLYWGGTPLKNRLSCLPQQWGECDYYSHSLTLTRSLLSVFKSAAAASQGMNFPVMKAPTCLTPNDPAAFWWKQKRAPSYASVFFVTRWRVFRLFCVRNINKKRAFVWILETQWGQLFPQKISSLVKWKCTLSHTQRRHTDAGAEVALLSNFQDQRYPLICSVSQSGPATESWGGFRVFTPEWIGA